MRRIPQLALSSENAIKKPFLLTLTLAVLSLLAACGGGGAGLKTPIPTVTISASSSEITLAQSVMLTWSSTNATDCTASANPSEADWSGSIAPNGNGNVTPASGGTVVYSLACSGEGGRASQSASIKVDLSKVAISSGKPPNGTTGARYNQRCRDGRPLNPTPPVCGTVTNFASGFDFTATGGQPPYAWSITPTLPPGMQLGDAHLDGTPSLAGSYDAVITLTDSASPANQASASYTIVISDPPPPVMRTDPPPFSGAVNLPYSFTFTASHGLHPLTWSEAGAPPPGLNFSTISSGPGDDELLSGTPTAAGSFPISLNVSDALGRTAPQQDFTIQIYLHGFAATGGMESPRTRQAATLLCDLSSPPCNNKRVLVVGGSSRNITTGLASAELYDPASGTFAATGNMATARTGPTATLLGNGKVLVTGGLDSGEIQLATAELYDPASGAFATTGSMETARSGHAAILLSNGKVLVTGGQTATSDVLASAELYDPASGTFTATGNMATARSGLTATLLKNGNVLVIGGGDASAELYDVSSGTFSPTGSMGTARNGNTATLLSSGKVLVTGGVDASAELYDPTTGTFSPTGSMGTARTLDTATLLDDGTVLVAGGEAGTDYLASAEIFNPTSGTFSPTGSLTALRATHTATLLNDGRVLVTGGRNGSAVADVNSTADLYQ